MPSSTTGRPANLTYGTDSYSLDGNDDGIMYGNSSVNYGTIFDGSSNTMMVGERCSSLAPSTWIGNFPTYHGIICSNPTNALVDCSFANLLNLGHTGPDMVNGIASWVDAPNYPASHVDSYRSNHSGGCNFLFGDGSTRFILRSINSRLYSAISTTSGSESVGFDQF